MARHVSAYHIHTHTQHQLHFTDTYKALGTRTIINIHKTHTYIFNIVKLFILKDKEDCIHMYIYLYMCMYVCILLCAICTIYNSLLNTKHWILNFR